jgi:ABC-type enterochelin transport system permease subunit
MLGSGISILFLLCREYHLAVPIGTPLTVSNAAFCIYWFCMILTVISDYFRNNINQLTFVMVKCGVLFEVRTEFLNNIYTSFVFKGLSVVLFTELLLLSMEIRKRHDLVGWQCSEYSSKGKTSGPITLLSWLFVRICKSVASTLLIAVVFSGLFRSCSKFTGKVLGCDWHFLVP